MIAVPLQIRDQLELTSRDYSACAAADCPHRSALMANPEPMPCPAGHVIRFRNVTQHNTFVTPAIDAIVRQLVGEQAPFSLQLLYAAAGGDNTPTVDSQSKLNDEIGRVALTTTQKLGQVGTYYKQVQAAFYFDEGACNGNLQEFGLFAGAATVDKDSGSLIARALNAWGNKDPNQTVNGIWTITLSG